ncbi:MAG: VWA domain-containing protein, partial [Methanoregula sp.]|nr:VWA domain-containing protein [Methanoregula sp.]
MEMLASTIDQNNIKIFECTSIPSTSTLGANVNTCAHGTTAVAMQPTSYDLFVAEGEEAGGSNNFISMSPVGDTWDDNAYYQVVLSDDLKSAPTSYYYGDEIRYLGEQSLKATRPCGNGTAYCFIFRTDSQTCKLNQVIITPKKYWTAVLEAPMNYRVLKDNASDPGTALYYKGNGLSDQHCIMMNMDDFNWDWSTGEADYAVTYGMPTGTHGNLTQVSALANTVSVGLVDPDNAVNIIGTATKDGSTIPASSPTTDGLVAWWNFDEDGINVIDNSGHGHDGMKWGSVSYITGKVGTEALYLNGSTAIILDDPITFPGGYSSRSICAWGKPDDLNTGWRWMFAYGNGTGAEGRAMFIGQDGVKLDGGGFGAAYDIIFDHFWDTNWHHICLTYNGDIGSRVATLYADGAPIASANLDWNLQPYYAYIGGQVFSAPSEFWKGAVDDIRVYNRVLSNEEIEVIYNNVAPVSGPTTVESKTGVSPLTIDLSNPRVVDYWPNCLEACTNAEIAAKFNILMSSHNLNDNTVKLDICKDENCSVLEEVPIAPKLNESDSRTIIISLDDLSAQLATNTIYQVTLSHTSTSSADGQLWSGASSTNSNLYSRPMQTQFVWRFMTKNEKCVVDNVQIMPTLFSAIYVHDKKVYSAEARSAPDACNAKGQLLNAWSVNWLWQSSSTSVATVQSFVTHGHNNACSANCIKTGSSIAYGISFEPLCGNGRIEAGEDCDLGVSGETAQSCTLNCLRPGSALATCGNGTIESAYGEECEPDISASNGCSANCLNMGSNASTGAEDIGASICGNGTVGAGEDCDLGIAANYLNPTSTLYCSANCLHTGTSLSANWCAVNTTTFGGFTQGEYLELCATAMSQCGDGIASPGEDAICETASTTHPVADGCSNICLANSLSLAECTPTSSAISYDHPVELKIEGCSELGQHEGSSLLYSTSSVCGDENVGIGEDPACESGFVITHNYTDPWALVTGVGLGTPIGEPPAQISDIIGTGQQTIGTKTYTASGKGQFKIMCGYTTDEECQSAMGSLDYGVGDNSCCYNVAKLISTYPEKSTAPVYDICPNTYIEAKFDRLIDQNTLANGVFIARGYEGEHVCASGEVDVTDLFNFSVAYSSDGGVLHWFAKIWHRVIGFVKNLFGNTASAARTSYVADVFCAVNNYGTAAVVSDMAMGKYTTSTVVINLNTALATNTDYAVILSRDVRDMLGVSIGGSAKWRFITADEICTLNNVAVNPSEYMFTESGESTNFVASSTAANGQRIQPVFGYAWEYTWGPAVNDIINLTNTTSSINLVSAKNRNGEIVLTATADITQNIVGAPDVSLSGQSDVAVFLCENPWPSASASDFPFYDTSYDFSTFYCMDYGSPGFADDLPYMTSTAVYTAASSDYAKRYVFTNTDNKDAIGMQIFFNPNYFSVNEWYTNEGFSGGVGALKVDGYEALGNSFNYYIDALKTQTESSNTIYPNIYQFSLNNDATGETSEVFKQMMNNLKFNKKIRNEAFCADVLNGSDINYSMPCANDMDCRALADAANKNSTSVYVNNFICMNLKDKLQRNYVRLKDLRQITQNITYGRGLIGAWSMDAINYGRVADVSGHNLDGIVYENGPTGSGISITTGTIGQAMHLVQPYYPSSNSTQRSYLKLSQGTTIGDRSFTVGQWLKTTSTAQQPTLISNTSGTSLASRNGFRFSLANGQLLVSLGTGSNPIQYTAGVCSGKYVNDGVWHHVVAVFEREQPNSSGKYHIDCYVDGVLDGSVVMTSSRAPHNGMTENYTTNPVRIGAPSYHGNLYVPSTTLPFVADYDDVRIYGRALSEDEVSAWYANTLPVDATARYPKMAGNTFLTGQALSVWPDSWAALSSEIGFTLSTDPINKLAQAGTCYLTNTAGGYSACYKDSDCAPVSALGRLSYWTADNGDATDEGTLANKGSMVGAVGTDVGKGHGKAFSFSGDSSAYVSLPHKSEYNSNTFTVSAWIYPTKKNTATIIKKGGTDDSGASQGGFALEYSGMQFDGSLVHFNNGTIRFAVFPASSSAVGYYAIDSATPITINAWHNIVAVFDKTAGAGALYIDGVLAGTTFRIPPAGVVVSADDVQKAAFNEMNLEIGESFNGLIDNVAFYSRVLDSMEITNIRKGLCVLHDATTGWSAEDRRFSFVCNTSSYAYRYTYVSSTDSFLLRANLEQFASPEPNNWPSFKKAYVGNWVNFNYGICAANDEIASPYHVSCGDNMLGGTEECDPPGKTTYDSSACPSGSAISKTCSNQCNWLPSSSVTCREVAGGSCGDGKTQSLAGETCDDGALNGTRGRCNTTCSGILETCGNGLLDAGEFCDTVVTGSKEKCTFRAGVSTAIGLKQDPIFYFLVDLSGSMGGVFSSTDPTLRIDYVKTELPKIAYQFSLPATRSIIGIASFSGPSTTTYPQHLHEWAPIGYYNQAAVASIVSNAGFHAGGSTYLNAALNWFRNTVYENWSSDNKLRPINLVILTDGATSDGTDAVAATITALKPLGILTSVIGIQNYVASFDTWAAAGGTGSYIPILSSSDSIVAALLETYYSLPCREYNEYSGYSCAWDCNSFGGFCGDGAVASDVEECETDQTCTVGGSAGVNKCVNCQLQGCVEDVAVSGPCGDGEVGEDEACDRSDENGIKCI